MSLLSESGLVESRGRARLAGLEIVRSAVDTGRLPEFSERRMSYFCADRALTPILRTEDDSSEQSPQDFVACPRVFRWRGLRLSSLRRRITQPRFQQT